MTLFKQILKPFASFRGRLLAIVSFGIVSLALTASITTALVTGQQAADQMVAQGLKTVGILAEQSVLALIYESTANAEKPLETIMSFPDIVQAGVFYPDFSPLLATTNSPLHLVQEISAADMRQPNLIKETNLAWHFVAPVLIKQQEDVFPGVDSRALTDSTTETLGYSYLVMDKTALRDMQINMILTNIFIALSFAVLLSMLVNYGIDRMMQPLYKLIEVMKKNEQEQTRVYAELSGPKEITHIANVFNRMMGSLDERDRRLRRHGEELESMVQLRTRELVTARDAALTANRHKSEFLANMSHELRTPLQAIIGYADITKEEMELEGKDTQIEDQNRIIRNATRLLAMINNILDMAKAESGKMDLLLEEVQLESLLSEAIDAAMPILRQNKNQLESDYQLETSSLRIDREKLLQVIINLVSNAGKFTENGTVTLSAVLNEQSLLIQVKDSGIGLSETEQKMIFEEFRQVDGSTTRNFEGTGLGLAITKRFTELMNGSISVESKPEQGATFSILIPLPVEQPKNRTLSDFPSIKMDKTDELLSS